MSQSNMPNSPIHSSQVLVVYDRFGRLIHGSPHVAKDVLEYVVFEKHLANIYGKWRLHGKITPNWSDARPVGESTSPFTVYEVCRTIEDILGSILYFKFIFSPSLAIVQMRRCGLWVRFSRSYKFSRNLGAT